MPRSLFRRIVVFSSSRLVIWIVPVAAAAQWYAPFQVPALTWDNQKKGLLPARARSGCQEEVLIYMSMSAPLSRIVTLAVAILVLGAAATASARPKKPGAERTTTATTMCDGTPVIMQGMECRERPARGEEQKQQEPTQRAERPRVTPRGSGGPYVAAPLRTPSLTLPQQSTAPYIPPPVDNPSERINQLNHSFPLNRGLGNNPTDRDSYIRYNLNR